MALFRNTIMQRKFGITKLLYFNVLKIELLKRIIQVSKLGGPSL
jgi:hypothetical protein